MDKESGTELLRAFCNNKFYEDNKDYIVEDVFPTEFKRVIQTVRKAHKEFKEDLRVQELWQLYQSYFPIDTESKKKEIELLFASISRKKEPNLDIAFKILNTLWRSYELTAVAKGIMDVESDNRYAPELEELQDKLENIITNDILISKDTTEEYVSTDIPALFEMLSEQYQWKFNFPPIQETLGGFGAGILGLINARPDAGKTAFWVALTAGQGGFLAQGAKVHVIANEENAERTMIRCISAYTGMTYEDIQKHQSKATDAFSDIKDNIFMKNSVGMTLTELDRYCGTNEVDLLVIDQADKLHVKGRFGTNVEKLDAIYEGLREIAKAHEIGVIAVCQAGADAHNRLYYGYDALNGSKTGKAGECDWIMSLGMTSIEANEGIDSGMRMINIPKNKHPLGEKKPIPCKFIFPTNKIQELI